MPKAEERKLAAIMFADIVGYSRMMSTDEDQTLELLKDFEDLSSPIVTEFQGKILKKIGDEIFCEFNSSKNAVDAALKIQESISKYNDSRPKDFQLSVRIGIHIGDIVKRGDDIHGDGVNVASRIQPLASPGGICISSSVQDALRGHPKYNIIKKGEHEIKNILDKYSIFQVKTGYEKLEKISTKERLFKSKYPKIAVLVVSLLFLVCGSIFYFNIEEKEDNISDTFYYYIDSRQEIIDTYLNTVFSQSDLNEMGIEKVEVVSDELLKEIWAEVPPAISAKLVHKNINVFTPQSKKERKQFYMLPSLDYYHALAKKDTAAYHELDREIRKDLKHLDEELGEQHNINIDGYIVMYLTRLKFKDVGWANVWDFGYWYFEDNGELSWGSYSDRYMDIEDDPDDVDIREELADKIAEFVIDAKYGGTEIGIVDEILSDDLVSIKINNKNINVLKGNKLKQYRTYIYESQNIENLDDMFDRRLDDLKREVEYIIKNPEYIIDTGCESCLDFNFVDSREHDTNHLKCILEEYLKVTNLEIDSLLNYRNILKEPYLSSESLWTKIQVDKIFTLDVVKVTNTHIIAKIIEKNVDYIIPKDQDRVYIVID